MCTFNGSATDQRIYENILKLQLYAGTVLNASACCKFDLGVFLPKRSSKLLSDFLKILLIITKNYFFGVGTSLNCFTRMSSKRGFFFFLKLVSTKIYTCTLSPFMVTPSSTLILFRAATFPPSRNRIKEYRVTGLWRDRWFFFLKRMRVFMGYK